MNDVNLFIAFAAGGLSFLSPCVLPLIPSYLSFVSGISPREISEGRPGNARVMGNAVAFGVRAFPSPSSPSERRQACWGSLLLSYQDVVRVVGGLFILVVGVYLTGLFQVATLERYAQFNLRSKPAGYLGSVLVGLTFAVAWIPCVGPILGAVLTLAGTASEIYRGMLLLSAYAAGLALPFLLSALAMNQFFRLSPRHQLLAPGHPHMCRPAADRRRRPPAHRHHDRPQRLRPPFHPGLAGHAAVAAASQLSHCHSSMRRVTW